MSESKLSPASRRIAELEAEARYARECYDLYKAKVYGSRPSSPGQLRKLQEACRYAEARLERARADG